MMHRSKKNITVCTMLRNAVAHYKNTRGKSHLYSNTGITEYKAVGLYINKAEH